MFLNIYEYLLMIALYKLKLNMLYETYCITYITKYKRNQNGRDKTIQDFP